MTNTITLSEESLSLPDGYAAHCRIFRPQGSIKSVVVYLHGIQSHGGWYEASGRYLAERGRLVVMPDRRGSGRNEKGRGDAASAWQLIADVRAAMQFAQTCGQKLAGHDLPLDLLGVSWGGKLAICYQEYDIKRMLILSDGPFRHVNGVHNHPSTVRSLTLVAPGLCPQVKVPLRTRLAVVGSLIRGQKERMFDLPLCDPTLFTDNAERQAFIREDPLALRQGTARLLFVSRELDFLARKARRRWAERPLAPPIHLVLAGGDRIIANLRTQRWFGPTGQRLTVSEFPGAGHTLEFEPNPSDYFCRLADWLEKRDVDTA